MQVLGRHMAPIIFLFFCTVLQGQDLILNASFERCNLCPTKLGSFDQDVIHWTSPTLGSTDYFNSCSPLMGTPENFNGKQPAHDGTAYAGFYLFAPDDYREYVQTRLTNTLEENREYKLTFFLSRAEGSDFAIKDIGVLFIDRELKVATKKTLTRKHWFASGISEYTYREFKGDSYWQQTRKWVKIEVGFTAKRSEKYLVVGNFKPNKKTLRTQTTRGAKKGAYYYIDQFTLEPVVSEVKKPIALNTSHRFQNVLFEFDRSILLDSAKMDIQRVYQYLEENNDIRIHIDGHTDNVGSAGYNEALSGHRCRAVANYLVQLGLSEDRISWRAHGGKNPIADNTTEKGRSLNRRVEFILKRNESVDKALR